MRRIRSMMREGTPLVFVTASTLGLAAIVALELSLHGADVRRWDVLFDSAWVTVVAGLWLARGLPDRFAAMVERLKNRGAFARDCDPLAPADISDVEAELRRGTRRSELFWAVAIGALIALSFVGAKSTVLPAQPSVADVVSTIVISACIGALGGLLVGRVVGRMLHFGSFGRSLARHGISFRATPGHVDGAAGLKPLGDYYLHQSLLLAIPAVFLLIWSLLLLAPAFDRYERWRPWYVALLTVAICLEWAAFAAPLRRAHRAMRQQKRAALVRADEELGPLIAMARQELEQDLDADRRSAVRDRLDQLTTSYREIDTMPTWPLDRSLRRRLTLGNIAIVVPLAIQVSTEATKALD